MRIASSYSLAPINSKLKKDELSHLLGRCLFGVSIKDFEFFKGKDINQCMESLLKRSPAPEMLAQDDPDIIDPLVPRGTQWINAPYESEEIDKKRRFYLKAWWVGQIINRDYSLTEKMTLFWHNHFVTEMDIVKDGRYSYQYVHTLRSHALGNFKNLIREGTTNIAMLVYLNGNSNNKEAPNENYSRELMELFTLGKDPHVRYTEEDVKAAARVLTGWKDDKETLQTNFHPELHDTDDKRFSSFFDHTIIKGRSGASGAIETDELVDVIFCRKETAKYFCRNLYRWLVCAQIDDRVETEIITPLAYILQANNYEVSPVLRTLLSSEHFFDPAFRGCIVKSPVDFWIGASKQFDLAFPAISVENHLCWLHYMFYLGGLSMMIGDPPSVAGWPAFYQAPKFHQWWINSYTLSFRMKIIDSLIAEEGLNCNGPRIKFDFSNFVRQLENPEDPDKLINSSVEFLLAMEISQSDKNRLKAVLLSGQEADHYWTDAWNKFIADPENKENKGVIETRLKEFYRKIINMPEYQII